VFISSMGVMQNTRIFLLQVGHLNFRADNQMAVRQRREKKKKVGKADRESITEGGNMSLQILVSIYSRGHHT
jgi:hypothetical protein